MYNSLPGFSVHGTFLARILEWVAVLFSRGSSQPRDRTPISCFSCVADTSLPSHQGSPPLPYSGIKIIVVIIILVLIMMIIVFPDTLK